MKTVKWYRFFVMAVVITVALLTGPVDSVRPKTASAQPPPPIIIEDDFDDGNLDGWTISAHGSLSGAEASSEEYHSPPYSLKLWAGGMGGEVTPGAVFYAHAWQDLPGTRGLYRITFAAKNPHAGVIVENGGVWRNDSVVEIVGGGYDLELFSGDDFDWDTHGEISLFYTGSPSKITFGERLEFLGGARADVAPKSSYFDDIRVRKVLSLADYEGAMDLTQGANYISFPVLPSDSFDDLFGYGVEVWAYDPDTGWYAPEYAESGRGYLVSAADLTIVSWIGVPVTDVTWDSIVAGLESGWNLVGPGNSPVTIASNEDIIEWSKYENKWNTMHRGDVLIPGRGYWIWKE